VERRELFQREAEGRTQRGEVLLRLTPLERSAGLRLKLPEADATALPAELQAVLRESLEQACRGGVHSGYPMTDLEVRVLEAPFQPGITTDIGLRAAAQRGVALAAREGTPTLLEPVMSLELVIPGEYAGRVIGSLQQKRGRVEGMQSRGETELIRAKVPLAEMFGYMTELRSATKGRGTFTMEFSHFDQAPPETLQRFGFA
jgi:elongation factor G